MHACKINICDEKLRSINGKELFSYIEYEKKRQNGLIVTINCLHNLNIFCKRELFFFLEEIKKKIKEPIAFLQNLFMQ